MAYWLQLRILLWKNLTLKRRTPFVLMFELFIPLVLFVILLAIRKKQPAYPFRPDHFHAQPLPSAGIMAIMQEFCRTGETNEYGFFEHPNSTVYKFLENFNDIAQHNNFFNPGFSPEEMDHIPELYRSIIEDPAALHDKFKQAHDFQISTVFSNISMLEEFLSKNFSIPRSDLDAVFSAQVNVSELYNLLFGTFLNGDSLEEERRHRYKRDLNVENSEQLLGKFADIYNLAGSQDSNLDFATGLIYRALSQQGDWQTDPETLEILSSLLGFGRSKQELDPVKVVDVLRKIVLSPYALHYIACENDELTSVLIPEKPEDGEKLLNLSSHICNMTDHQLKEVSNALQKSLNTEAVIELLDLRHLNLTSARITVREFIANLTEFWTFEYNLLNLSKFASQLPQNACRTDQPANFTVHYNTTDPGVTERPEEVTRLPHIDEGPPKKKKVPTATLR